MEGPAESEVIPSAPERRARLIEEMRRLAAEGKHCAACSGICCTFLANSMQITPVEAVDLRDWLITQGRWDATLQQSLRDCIAKFRLDVDLGDGRRSLRKTYTCPFYHPGPKGCSISPEHKPYGCLAFNARQAGLTEGGNCASDQSLLEIRAAATPAEAKQNRMLKDEHHWLMEKAPIPVALLALAPR
jgi:Fe-S-cluster containining protein